MKTAPTPLPTPRQILMDEVAEIAARHGVDVASIMSRSRKRAVVAARYEAYHHVWLKFQSLPRTSTFFDRDHTTVAYGIGRYLSDACSIHNWMTRLADRKRATARDWHKVRRMAA